MGEAKPLLVRRPDPHGAATLLSDGPAKQILIAHRAQVGPVGHSDDVAPSISERLRDHGRVHLVEKQSGMSSAKAEASLAPMPVR